MAESGPRVALFATCLVDLFRPAVGFAAVELLRAAGCRVVVPRAQTCCGQPAYNTGDRATTKRIALQVMDACAEADYIVVPSGSCGGMLAHHYPALFADDPDIGARARAFGERTHELVSFLVDVMGMRHAAARHEGIVTYHDGCAGLRELGVSAQPRTLLASVEGLELRELPEREVCCGFGGTFCVKYPDISAGMVAGKVDAIVSTGAATVLAGDMGCLLNIAGCLKRRGAGVHARHVAEVLAGSGDAPPIGEAGETP